MSGFTPIVEDSSFQVTAEGTAFDPNFQIGYRLPFQGRKKTAMTHNLALGVSSQHRAVMYDNGDVPTRVDINRRLLSLTWYRHLGAFDSYPVQGDLGLGIFWAPRMGAIGQARPGNIIPEPLQDWLNGADNRGSLGGLVQARVLFDLRPTYHKFYVGFHAQADIYRPGLPEIAPTLASYGFNMGVMARWGARNKKE
jgi:hypothetical protein